MDGERYAFESSRGQVVMVNFWATWCPPCRREFPNFPILFDRASSVSQAFGVNGLPTTVLIDKQGRIVYRAVGGRDFNHPEVKAIIRELLAAPVAQ